MGDLVPRGEFFPLPLACDGFDFLVVYFIMLARQGEKPLSLEASKQCAPNRVLVAKSIFMLSIQRIQAQSEHHF